MAPSLRRLALTLKTLHPDVKLAALRNMAKEKSYSYLQTQVFDKYLHLDCFIISIWISPNRFGSFAIIFNQSLRTSIYTFL